MNTRPEPPGSDFEEVERSSIPTTTDNAIAALERQLQRVQDKRNEERFIWTLVSVLLIDIIAFPGLGWAMIPVFLLELILLIATAKWFGIDWAVVLLERIFGRYLPNKNGDDR